MSKQFILSGLFILFSLIFYSSCRRVHLEQTGNWTQNPDNPGDSSRTNPVDTIREKTTDIIVNDPESDNQNRPDDPQESVIEQTNNMTGSDPEPDQDHPAGSDESGEMDTPTEQTPPDSGSDTSTDDPPEELTNQQRCDAGETHVFVSENTQNHTKARSYCQQHGADVFAHHIRKYSYLHSSLGPLLKGALWIQSWNTDDYEKTCLLLHEGVAVTEGACSENYKVLCECNAKQPDYY